MGFVRFRNLDIFTKIMSVSLLTLVLVGLGVVFYLMPMLEDQLMASRREASKQLVETAYSLVAATHAKALEEGTSRAEARRRAIRRLSELRYGNDDNYFWINDLDGVMVAHPAQPELIGTDMSGVKDSSGFPLFVEFVRLAKAEGEGYVAYLWPKMGEADPQPKISYVKLFQPWGWVVGTGLYVDDVADQIADLRMRTLVPLGIMALGILLLNLYIARRISQPLLATRDAAQRLSLGDLDVVLPEGGRDEAGQLTAAMDTMIAFQRSIAESARKIAAGDLTVRVTPKSGSDVMARALERMIEDLHGQIGEITNAVGVLAASATQIATSMDELAASSNETAALIGETMTSMEQIKQNAQTTFDKAKAQSDNARAIAGTAAKGLDATEANLSAMEAIREKTGGVLERIGVLREQAMTINSIVATVEDLADQSKVLAVNASIEAAKSGREGEGFAVVAGEMRQLSEQSKEATGRIRTILSDVLRAVESVTGAGRESSDAVKAGVEQSRVAGDVIKALAGTIEAGTRDVMEIAAASRQEFAAVEQVVEAMGNIREAGQMIQTVTSQLSDSAKGLDELSRTLKESVGRYKI